MYILGNRITYCAVMAAQSLGATHSAAQRAESDSLLALSLNRPQTKEMEEKSQWHCRGVTGKPFDSDSMTVLGSIALMRRRPESWYCGPLCN